MRHCRFPPRHLLAAAALLALAACDSTPDIGEEDDARSASGEVLEGSISDAMIATESVQSQAPLLRELPQAAATDGEPADAADTGDAEDDAAPEAAPEPEPAPAD